MSIWNLLAILNNEINDVDDSFLKVSAFNQQIQSTNEYDIAKEFYDLMLADSDEVNVLLEDVSTNGSGVYNLDLNKNSY